MLCKIFETEMICSCCLSPTRPNKWRQGLNLYGPSYSGRVKGIGAGQSRVVKVRAAEGWEAREPREQVLCSEDSHSWRDGSRSYILVGG